MLESELSHEPRPGVPDWLHLLPLVASVPCFCLNSSLCDYSMYDPMWSIFTIRFFCCMKFLEHCIFCLPLSGSLLGSQLLVGLDPFPGKSHSPCTSVPGSVQANSRDIHIHSFIQSVSKWLSEQHFFGANVACRELGWSWLWSLPLEGVGTGWCQLRSRVLGVTHVVDVDLGSMIRICIQVSDGQGHSPLVITPLTTL